MWVVLAFVTAILTSCKDICGRRALEKTDHRVVAWAWPATSLPFLFAALLWIGIPEIRMPFWPALLASGTILTIASILFFRSIQISELSLSVPMLAFTPVFLLVTSPLILKEFPQPLGLAGILLIVFGSYVMNFGRSRQGFWEPFRYLLRNKGSQLMLYVSLMYSIGGNIDKIGVLNSSPAMWIFSLNLCVALMLSVVVGLRVKHPVASGMKSWKVLVLMGVFTSIALLSQMYAIRMTIVPYVIAIKRTSVVMTALFGLLWFKEKGLQERMIGIVLMIMGVFLISFVGS